MADPLTSQPAPWVSVAERLPPENQQVLVLIADPSVAIFAHPTCARLQIEFRGTPRERHDWWAGVPGKWMPIRPDDPDGWTVTHWTRMPEFDTGSWKDELRAAAWKRWEASHG